MSTEISTVSAISAISAINAMFPTKTTRIGDEDVQTVSARTIHERIESQQDFSTWVKARIEKYGFVDGQDFSVHKIVDGDNSSRFASIEYEITMDMAKELGMVEGNAKGQEIRQYFIAAEKEMKRLQIDNQALLEQQTKTLLLENKALADENFELNDRNEYLEDKKAMWKDERIQGILRDEVEAQIGIRHELEEKVFSDKWLTCNGDPMNKDEAKSRKKFVKQRFSQVNQGLKGLERVIKGTEQARNAAILTYISIIRQEIEFAHYW